MIFKNKNNTVRIVWLLASLFSLIFISEFLIVDPLTILIKKIGLSEVTSVLPENWSQAIGDSVKRIIRTIGVVISAIVVIKYLYNKNIKLIGIYFNNQSVKYVFYGIALGFLVQVVSIILMLIFGWYKITGFTWQFNSLSFILAAIFYSIIYCLETGVIEEVIFRGFIFNIFERRHSTNIAIIVSSIIFGILHFSGFNQEFSWLMSITSSLFVGIMLAQAYLLFRNIWFPIGIHFAWHLAARTLGSVGLNSDEAILLVTKVKGPSLLVSTKAGGAGLFELFGVVLVMIILFFVAKSKCYNLNRRMF